MDPIILETMNDIINHVDAREWRRVNDWGNRVVKKWKREKEKVEYWKNSTGEAEDKLDEQMKVNEEMSENWEVATEKIGQENSDLHNEIKRLKKENKDMKQNLDYWKKEAFSKDNLKIQNEKLKEKVEDSFQRGFDAGREEYEVDKEYLDEKDEEIERLKNEIKLLKGDEEPEYPDRDYECMYELGAYNMMRGLTDEDYANCWKAKLTGKAKTYKEWIKLTDK